MEEFNNYTFRATTIPKIILTMLIWIVLTIVVSIPIQNFFHYEDIKNPTILINIKVFGTTVFISSIIILIISQYIISSRYHFDFKNSYIEIYKNNKLDKIVELSNINSFSSTITPFLSGIEITFNDKKKYHFCIGFIFNFKKEVNIFSLFLIKELNPFLLEKNFVLNIKLETTKMKSFKFISKS
ncbi:hypothetical protein ETU08_00360 [Apibacter muscae]|uniref:hypothetical protein n=1 Tax=Apibacter muscae TaxID=2509004 RepID=UPI0011ADA78E|nr:hypothetical protein [Apibacter muscae]TWP31792.1 hypothetical protein ETU08_00360 [Apibacter muscae]